MTSIRAIKLKKGFDGINMKTFTGLAMIDSTQDHLVMVDENYHRIKREHGFEIDFEATSELIEAATQLKKPAAEEKKDTNSTKRKGV